MSLHGKDIKIFAGNGSKHVAATLPRTWPSSRGTQKFLPLAMERFLYQSKNPLGVLTVSWYSLPASQLTPILWSC